MNIAERETTLEIVSFIVDSLRNGEVVYLHCRGGHGRTGYIGALVLIALFKISAYEALNKMQIFHDYRGQCIESNYSYACPETRNQKNEVYALENTIMDLY